MTMVPDLAPALPEIFLAAAAMALLMVGVFRRSGTTVLVTWLAAAALVVTLGLVLMAPAGRQVTFAGMFVSDAYAVFFKVLILVGAGLVAVMSLGYIQRERMDRFEYPVLILLATLGMMMMVSADDLISLFMSIELQALPIYVLAAFKRDSSRATEAGLKYFVLGALSSGMLLYGCSLIYGFSGTTNFQVLAEIVAAADETPIGLIIGIVFLVAGLAFKVSAVPFHMWAPDVYEGAPTPVTAFFATAPKVAAMALFVRAMVEPFGPLLADWRQIIIFISVASMILGAFAAIGQTNIKRLMAYSSIGHVGYALIGLAAGTEEGIRGVMIYMTIYLAMNLGTFACILSMRRSDGMVESIGDLAGLSKTHPAMALMMGIFMFSLAGVPPLAGFFGKLYIFIAAIHGGLYVLAVIGVVTSVVGAFYYLRIVKLMYFDDAVEPFATPFGRENSLVMAVAGFLVLFFFVYPGPLVDSARAAALAILG